MHVGLASLCGREAAVDRAKDEARRAGYIDVADFAEKDVADAYPRGARWRLPNGQTFRPCVDHLTPAR